MNFYKSVIALVFLAPFFSQADTSVKSRNPLFVDTDPGPEISSCQQAQRENGIDQIRTIRISATRQSFPTIVRGVSRSFIITATLCDKGLHCKVVSLSEVLDVNEKQIVSRGEGLSIPSLKLACFIAENPTFNQYFGVTIFESSNYGRTKVARALFQLSDLKTQGNVDFKLLALQQPDPDQWSSKTLHLDLK